MNRTALSEQFFPHIARTTELQNIKREISPVAFKTVSTQNSINLIIFMAFYSIFF